MSEVSRIVGLLTAIQSFVTGLMGCTSQSIACGVESNVRDASASRSRSRRAVGPRGEKMAAGWIVRIGGIARVAGGGAHLEHGEGGVGHHLIPLAPGLSDDLHDRRSRSHEARGASGGACAQRMSETQDASRTTEGCGSFVCRASSSRSTSTSSHSIRLNTRAGKTMTETTRANQSENAHS